MAYELRGSEILDKLLEAQDVGADAEATKDYIIPESQSWFILSVGGSTSADVAEIEFMFSPDGGETWLNPYDGTNDVLRCCHITKGTPAQIDMANPMKFDGDGVNTIIRIKVKNLNGTTADEIVGWLNGWIEYR